MTTATEAPTKLAVRHFCSLRDERGSGWRSFHTARSGKPRSARCTYCHGAFVIETGLFGVFVWDGDGRYPLERAVKTFTRESLAESYQYNNAGDGLVVRWIPIEV